MITIKQAKDEWVNLKYPLLAMIVIVILSNYLVLFSINDWLTWGAFTYPISYLINEMTNRHYGPGKARLVVYAGFFIAVILSAGLANTKIAIASGSAFLTSQLLDIFVFYRLRRMTWWYAPICASFAASLLDGAVFWTLAFYGENLPILTWAIGDTSIKLALDLLMLTPFRWMMQRMPQPQS